MHTKGIFLSYLFVPASLLTPSLQYHPPPNMSTKSPAVQTRKRTKKVMYTPTNNKTKTQTAKKMKKATHNNNIPLNNITNTVSNNNTTTTTTTNKDIVTTNDDTTSDTTLPRSTALLSGETLDSMQTQDVLRELLDEMKGQKQQMMLFNQRQSDSNQEKMQQIVEQTIVEKYWQVRSNHLLLIIY